MSRFVSFFLLFFYTDINFTLNPNIDFKDNLRSLEVIKWQNLPLLTKWSKIDLNMKCKNVFLIL